MTLNQQDSVAARSAISRGDLSTLERYLREGGSNKGSMTISRASGAISRLDEGKIILLNRAAGFNETLPPATGSQDKYTFIVQTTLTGSGIIKVANSQDSMIGGLIFSTTTLAAGSMQAPPAGSDTISMNGTTTGGAAGSIIKLVDIAPTLWMIGGTLVCVGAAATPYLNAV